jgi:hypothetical protein
MELNRLTQSEIARLGSYRRHNADASANRTFQQDAQPGRMQSMSYEAAKMPKLS